MALVMFDYDGVIVDSLDMFVADFVAACHENSFYKVNTRQQVLDLFEGNVYQCLKERGLDNETTDRILRSYSASSLKRLDELTLFSGMGEALQKIAEKNKIFIITSNISGSPLRVLQRHKINCFEDVLGAEKEKSKIKKISNTMLQYPDLEPYYVGDTTGDIIEGKKAGARAIGVAWGWHGAQKLLACSPYSLVYTPGELSDFFCNL